MCGIFLRSTKCEYLDGSCLASPRWVSLLVAEIYYPDTTFPSPGGGSGRPPRGNRQPVQGASPPRVKRDSTRVSCRFWILSLAFYQEYGGHYFQRRQGQATPEEKCDGHDEMGCYQVRFFFKKVGEIMFLTDYNLGPPLLRLVPHPRLLQVLEKRLLRPVHEVIDHKLCRYLQPD